MKKLFTLTGFFSLLWIISCNYTNKPNLCTLDTPWKFKTGDDLSWATTAFDDLSWGTIDPKSVWEDQGYKGYNGFAWYRYKTLIRSTLRDQKRVTDSLQIRLGKIDDCDQVFLNGKLIGENGRVIYGEMNTSGDFIKTHGRWNLERRYVLAQDDPRIQWDKENLIAVRSYDHGGPGGMFGKTFEISLTGLRDYLKIDLAATPFIFSGDTLVTKEFSMINLTGTEHFKGELVVEAVMCDNDIRIFSDRSLIDLAPHSKVDKSFSYKTNVSSPALLHVTFKEATTREEISEIVEVPYILTPESPATPRINGARVFGVRPWSPFLYKVAATGHPPLKFRASDLPEGLVINPENGLITGSLKKKGEYVVKLTVENQLGYADRDLKIMVGDLISLTPPMGWNSWNCWGLSVSDKKVRQSADAMKSSGLIEHGWSYINIDDGWEDTHDKDGNILANSKFPDMPGLCNYVHSLGLKIGIYSSPGPKTCGGYEGSYGFEAKDAMNYATWGIDYLKYDWCSYGKIAPDPTVEQMKRPYQEMKHALRKANRDIHYSLCQYGMGDVWTWGAVVDGNSWRTTGDIEDTWESMSSIGFSQWTCSSSAAPGRWNDPDMLVVGWVGWGPYLHYTRLTPNEQYTHITLWSLLAAPLLIGCDLNRLDAFTMNLLANDEVLAVNQDPLGKQALRVRKTDDYEVWARDLGDGSKAVGLFNNTEKLLYIPVEMHDLQLDGKWSMRDLWTQSELGKVRTHFEMKTRPHGARMVKLSQPD
ncbi:MAG: putative Ig domain-containing protein [Bacteroidales bacterium]|nr:putative Ig domain-containing protein [Bacteroidales bacterium]